MLTKQFAEELRKLDERLTIVSNPNRPGLSNIKFDNRDVCPVPSDEIKEESDPNYTYIFPNGMIARHKSRKEALAQVENVLELIKTEEGRNIFYDK